MDDISLEKKINNNSDIFNIDNYIEEDDRKIIFIYFVILIIILFIIQKVNVNLNTLLGIFLFFIILYIIRYNRKKEKHILELKKDFIKPKPRKINDYEDILNFVFSIQDLYVYNVPVYEDMIDNIDSLLEIYEQSKISNELAGVNYDLARERKKDAVNSLHSIIHIIPNSKVLIDKLNKAIKILDNILQNYIDEIYTINKNYIKIYGRTNKSKEIIIGPIESNFFNDDKYDVFS